MNKDPFESVVQAYREWMCAVARRFGFTAHEVEDVVQEALTQAFPKWKDFEGRSLVSTWLWSFVENVSRNEWRKSQNRQRRREALASAVGESNHHDREPLLMPHELEAFLATLDETRRAVFILREIEGYKLREIAEMLGRNVNTVASQLRAARVARDRYFEPRNTRTFAPGWSLGRWESLGAGAFCKGVAYTAVLVFGLTATRPEGEGVVDDESASLDPEPSPSPAVSDKPPVVDSKLPHPNQPPLPPERVEPKHAPVAVVPRRRSKKAAAARPINHQADYIERLYLAQWVHTGGAPSCVPIMLEGASVFAQPTSTSKSGEPGTWMNHVPNAGTLLDQVCQLQAKR